MGYVKKGPPTDLERRRKQARLSRPQIAARSGATWTHNTVHRIETQPEKASNDELFRFYRALAMHPRGGVIVSKTRKL